MPKPIPIAALAYYKKGEVGRAIAEYTKAIELNPNYATAYNNRGATYAEKDDYERAIKNYTKAIDLKPNYAEAYANRGNAYFKRDDYDPGNRRLYSLR